MSDATNQSEGSATKPNGLHRAAIAVLGRTGVFTRDAVSLGQTLAEMEAIYGKCQRMDLLNGREFVGFEKPGLNVIAVMEEGKSAALRFARSASRFFRNEIRALLSASAAGSRWTRKPGAADAWTRDDGKASALLSGESMLFIFDADAGARFVKETLATP